MGAAEVMDPRKDPGLAFGALVLKSAAFSHREDFLMVPPTTRHKEQKLDVEISVLQGTEGDDLAGISIRVSTEPNDRETLYHFSVEILAMINRQGDAANLPPMEFVRRSGVAALYPFVREAIANLTMRGRFGPIWLNPINPAILAESEGPRP